MNRFNSDFLKFEPIDPKTPEGKARLSHFLKRALNFRCTSPAKEGCMVIPYDRNGVFGTPIYSENILHVLLVSDYGFSKDIDPHVLNFCKKFCELYLKTENGTNRIRFVTKADFSNRDGYRVAFWVRGDEDLPFEPSREFFGRHNGKPVYILGQAMIEACRGLDLDSPQVLARMKMVYEDSVKKY